MTETLVVALATLGIYVTMFVPLERMFSFRRQPLRRPQWRLDLTFFFAQQLLWGTVTFAVVAFIKAQASGLLPDTITGRVATQAWWVKAAIVIVTVDVAVYWFHRACHRYEALWRIHRVHHTAEHLDWLAAHREHPLDGILTAIAGTLPAVLLGIPLAIVAPLTIFRGLWAVYIHSNARLPLGWLRVLVGAPELHHWHHARVERTRHNFSNLAPWTDLVFGTYYLPGPSESYELGVTNGRQMNYIEHLTSPVMSHAPEPGAHEGPVSATRA